MKKIISILMVICMVVPMFAAFSVSAATPTDSYTFDGDHWYFADNVLADAPRTVEAWIYVDPAYANQTKTIISNYNGFTGFAYWHLAVKYENGVLFPYFEWNELSNNSNSIRKFNFREAAIKAGEWTHIAVVINAPNAYVSCYKNGAFIQSNGANIQFGDIVKNVTELPLVIGNDNRPAAQNTSAYRAFHGKIASISLFNDIRTADEVASDYKNGADNTDANNIAHWEFSSSAAKVTDKSKYKNNLSLSQFWLTESEMEAIRGNDFDPAYSFAIVGDIQYMTEHDAANGTKYVKTLHEWIVNNKDSKNIKYMMGMGDITNRNISNEWEIALEAISVLNGKLPYTVVQGNHDLYTSTTGSGDKIPGKTGLGYGGFDKYFAVDTSANTDYIDQFKGLRAGLYKSGSVANSWYSFNAEGTDWLVIGLEFAPNDDILKWANKVVEDHPDHKVIMTTHGYCHMDGTPISDEDSNSLSGKDSLGKDKNNGEEMWTKFASLHENIVMVISGHMESNLITVNQAKGVNGNTVTQFLIDQQTVDHMYMDAGQAPLGLVAMFYFDKDGNNVSIEWYSTLHNKYYQTRNQLSFDMKAESKEQNFGWCGVLEAPEGSGSEKNPYIIKNGGNLLWMSKQLESNTSSNAKFDGKYFKQICDIDLDGNVIRPIGYYHSTESGSVKMSAFGGSYDGGGYSIKNGHIAPYHSDHEFDINWADGLFGVIYGATIKNVTLDNIDVWSKGIAGGIVGKAAAPLDGKDHSDFNIISGCKVTSSCTINETLCYGKTVNSGISYGNKYHAGIVGSICGMAYATTFEACTSSVDIAVDGNHSLVGGIVGVAGYNTNVEYCAFDGGITLKDNKSKTESSFGGIVGAAINSNFSTANGNDDSCGYLKISNCYNKGSFTYSGSASVSKETHWGGIIGNASYLYNIDYNEKDFLIDSCYNLYEKSVGSNENGIWIGGLVGHAAVREDKTDATLWINDSATVAVDAFGGAGTNEYRHNNKTNYYDQLAVSIVNGTAATKTAAELEKEIKDISDIINNIQITPEPPADDNGPNDSENENNGNGSSGNKEEKPTETAPTETQTEATEAPEKKGCGSVIGGGAIIVLMTAALAGCAIIKKKEI